MHTLRLNTWYTVLWCCGGSGTHAWTVCTEGAGRICRCLHPLSRTELHPVSCVCVCVGGGGGGGGGGGLSWIWFLY